VKRSSRNCPERMLPFLFFLTGMGLCLLCQEALVSLLPEDGIVEGWLRKGKLLFYAGDDLYAYIDGGAELYHEYGFERVVVQDFENPQGKSVSVEIYEMSAPESAFGIFSFKTDKEERDVPLGDGGRIAEYYLNFWKGPFLVTLTGFDATAETVQGLLDIAREVDSRIPGRGQLPWMVNLLPGEGLDRRSVKYFKGWLGLRNSHPSFRFEVGAFEEGVKGEYASGLLAFLFRYSGEKECRGRWQKLREEIPGSEAGAGNLPGMGSLISGRSRGGEPVAFFFQGPLLGLLLGDVEEGRAAGFLRAFSRGVKHKGAERAAPFSLRATDHTPWISAGLEILESDPHSPRENSFLPRCPRMRGRQHFRIRDEENISPSTGTTMSFYSRQAPPPPL